MTSSNNINKATSHFSRQLPIAIGFIVLPFLLMYWLVPFVSELTIGNDYSAFPIEQQMELTYSLEQGTFPLYAPGFAGGQSASAMTLGQLYHPLPHIARHIPGYWQGDALSINTVLRLVFIGLCHLVVFHLLRRLGLGWVAALCISVVTVFNLRMLDHFRYGASLENHTAFIMLCGFVTLYFFQRNRFWYGLGIVLSSYLLAVGGHPQILYLGYLGAAIVTLIVPWVVPAITSIGSDTKIRIHSYFMQILLLVIAGMLLAAPYIAGFYFDFVANNTLRADNPYEWSLAYQDSWGGGLRSLYAPLSADVSGAFGGSALIIMAVFLPTLLLFRQKVPWSIYASLLVVVLAFLLSIGDATPLHYLVWKYFPLADNFRTPGRYSLLILFPLMFVLAWVFKSGIQQQIVLSRNVNLPVLAWLALASLAFFIIANTGLDHLFPESSRWTPEAIQGFSSSVFDWMFYLGICTFVSLFVFALSFGKNESATRIFGGIVILSILIQTGVAMRHGTWVTDNEPRKTLQEMDADKKELLKVQALEGYGMVQSSVVEQMDRSIISPKLARLYRRAEAVQETEEIWRYLSQTGLAKGAVFLSDKEKSLAGTYQGDEQDTIELVRATFNEFVFDVKAHQPVLMATNIPLEKNWRATINGEPTTIYRANGTETSLILPEGRHTVSLRYDSPATWYGGLVAMLTLSALLFYCAWRISGTPRSRYIFGILAIVVPVTCLYLWQQSFYGGKGLDHTYSWTSAELPAQDNVAFGKATAASSLYNPQMPIYFYPGLAVDGNKQGGKFATGRASYQSWKVDLGSIHKLNEIRIHGMNKSSLPVTVLASKDNKNFEALGNIRSHRDILAFSLGGQELRYLAIRGSGLTASLAFSEVELFGKPL